LPAIVPIEPDKAIANAQQHFPALIAAESEKRSFVSNAEAISSGNYRPSFDLQASRMSGVDIMGYHDPGQMYVSVKWNLFQGFSGDAQEKSMLSRANATEEKYQQLLLDIDYKINSAWDDYNNQTDRIKTLTALSNNTEQVRSDYFVQWETLGKRSLLEVLTAESEHLNTLLSLASSELDQQLALARLRYESGTLASWTFE
jgi:adhesin transport system outer membrane protein